MTDVWAVPGYDVQALIGYGATGEVWRARELATGDAVALKRLRAGADLAAIESLRRDATVLRALDTPYVVRLRALLGEGADTVLVLDLAGGGSLAALLARRGTLDPGEVVTVAAPLAQALAAAHACGLVHGDVTPSNLLFTSEGMPLLADLGLARLAGEPVEAVDGTAEYVDPAVAAGGQPDAAADVWALAAVCHRMLSGTVPHDGTSVGEVLDAAQSGQPAPLGLLAPTAPPALVSAIESAMQADPAARPDAAAFAAAIRRSHAAAPVRLTGGVSGSPAARTTHRVHSAPAAAPEVRVPSPNRRRLLVAGAGVALLGVAAAIGWASGRSGGTELASVPAATTSVAHPAALVTRAPDWRSVLDGLDAARADAFARGDADRLSAVYAPASPLLAADRAALERLHVSAEVARGVRHALRSVTPTSYDEQFATLRTVDVLSAYVLLDASGHAVQRVPARGAESFVVTLVHTPRGWRLMQVHPT